jgi:hypothetical protein
MLVEDAAGIFIGGTDVDIPLVIGLGGNAILTLSGSTLATANAQFAYTLDATNSTTAAVTLAGGLGVAKQACIGTNLLVAGTTDATTKDTGCVIVEGGIGVEKQVCVGTNAIVLGTTDATSKTTGCLITTGGAGIGKDAWIGGKVHVDDTTDATGVTGTVGSIATLGGISSPKQILAPNLVNCEKGKIIELVYALIPAANIITFLIFDETGAVTTIKDRGTLGHNATLGGNASTLTPTVVGLCPSLLFADAAATEWSIADHADFSFGNGGVDTPWSTVSAVVMTDVTSTCLMAKYLVTGSQLEWQVNFNSNDKLGVYCYNAAGTKSIGRYYNTALTGDEGATKVYITTASGGGGGVQAIAGLKVYRDGTELSCVDSIVDVYAGMTSGTAPLSNSRAGVSTGMKGRAGVQILCNIELSAATAKRLSNLLLAYMGVKI